MDPIAKLGKEMVEQKIATQDDLDAECKAAQKTVDEAIQFARSSPYPKPEEALEDVFVG